MDDEERGGLDLTRTGDGAREEETEVMLSSDVYPSDSSESESESSESESGGAPSQSVATRPLANVARTQAGETEMDMGDVPSAVSQRECGPMVVGMSNGRRRVEEVVKCMGRYA